jgi:hypothetical protein
MGEKMNKTDKTPSQCEWYGRLEEITSGSSFFDGVPSGDWFHKEYEKELGEPIDRHKDLSYYHTMEVRLVVTLPAVYASDILDGKKQIKIILKDLPNSKKGKV